MKFVCLGYIEPNKFEDMPETERNAFLDECFTYDDSLRNNGHFAGGEALQSAHTARTLRWKNGKISVTDGPYAETKEFLGGILVLEARDLDHAVELISKHPGARVGPFEIRPAADLGGMIRESEQRRAKTKALK
ncbi:MAG TPA: YciI family protein [Vicinamibacterales bacterium]